MRRVVVLIAVVAAMTSCRSYPDLPVTEHSKPMTALDAAMPGTAPAVATSVTSDRLRNARSEPANWMTYYGAYDGQRYSALDQINTSNVRNLRPAWQFEFGPVGIIPAPATYSFEAAPIVVDGVMFISGWDGYVWAIDAATGQTLWQYQHQIPIDTPLCCGNVNRGVAVAAGRVFVATPNGYLVALDATNGKLAWQTAFADVRAGESATAAPLVVKNLVIVGSSGAEYGVRGHIDAFDLSNGQRVWRRYTIPAPGEPGSDTWTGDSWQRGGGTTWVTGTYDPALDLLYWSTGNPGPLFDDSMRTGTNLYTDSVLALDPNSGAIRWHYQFTPHDVYDYDGVNENILFDQNGRRLLAHFDRNGYLFILDRTNGQLVRVTQFGERVTWGTIDASGRVTQRLKPTALGTEICPGPAGSKEWTHAAYNPRTGLLYAPVMDTCATFRIVPQQYREGMFYLAGDADVTKSDQMGRVKAVDPATGRQVWSWTSQSPMVASVLTTAGDLVFAGEPNGHFNAYDARSGGLLWTYQTGNGIHSNPVTYSVGGKQYIALPTGWGGWLEGFAPEMLGAPRGTSLVVFALP
jgi:alcohol dehydrogenase (cytochrome c)